MLPKRFIAPFLLMLALMTTQGCMEITHDLKLKSDGSGTYTLKYSITESAITQFKAIEKLTVDLARAGGEVNVPPQLHPLLAAMLSPQEDVIAKLLKPYRANGLSVKNLKVTTRNASRQVDLAVAFADIKQLEDTDFFRTHGFELRREAEGHYVFWRRPHIDAKGKLPPPPDNFTVKQLSPILNGFKTTVRVTMPGRIMNSTALRTTLYTASWVFDFDENPNALLSLQHQPFRVEFESGTARLPEVSYAGKATLD